MNSFNEDDFQDWYRGWAEVSGINPDPDSQRNKYDYRAAYEAGIRPSFSFKDGKYHWPSEFKMDAKTGLPVNEVGDSAEFLKALEADKQGLDEPWVDPTAAFSGGFGALIPKTVSKIAAKQGLKILAKPVAAGISGSIADYPLGLATEYVDGKAPVLALPFNILAGAATGKISDEVIDVLRKNQDIGAKFLRRLLADPKNVRTISNDLAEQKGIILQGMGKTVRPTPMGRSVSGIIVDGTLLDPVTLKPVSP